MSKRIGILQVDGKKYQGVLFPNMALMKICGYHEAQGDSVEWYNGNLYADQYDVIYASKIFSFSPMPDLPREKSFIGGTGIDYYNLLPPEIEATPISYSLYPDVPFHVGFAMKGCRFNCGFCGVPKKEGRPRINDLIDAILTNPKGGNRLMLLDNDFFGVPNWQYSLERIIELKLKVCFVQGLNIRIITDDQAALLAKCNYTNSRFNQKYLSFAWDRFNDGKLIIQGIERCNKAGIPSKHMQFFVLVGFDSTPEQDMHRINTLKELGALPFVMPYNKENPYQKALARWVNSRPLFRSVKWEDYKYNPNRKKLISFQNSNK